jgi:hypothetical protein
MTVRGRGTLYSESRVRNRVSIEIDTTGVRFRASRLHRQRQFDAIPWSSITTWRTNPLVGIDIGSIRRKAELEICYGATTGHNVRVSVVTSASVARAATTLATDFVDNDKISNAMS